MFFSKQIGCGMGLLLLAVAACSGRSEGKALADALRGAGSEVEYRNYEGSTHEFFGMNAVLEDASAAQRQAAAGLKKGFSSTR